MSDNLDRDKEISLPKDNAPHSSSNIEWWNCSAILSGEQGEKYALLASFGQLGELESQKGHYLIYTLIDLNNKVQESYSFIDSKLKMNMVLIYLPFYFLLYPTDIRMWNLYKSLVKGENTNPHKKIIKAIIKNNPTQLLYDSNQLTFLGERENSFKVHLEEENLEINLEFTPTKPMALIGEDGKPDDFYYYSFTNNQVKGQIKTDKGIANVEGEGWFDHKWGKDYGLIKGTRSNWYGIQLDDDRELLLNDIRYANKTSSHFANLIEADGSVRFTKIVSFLETRGSTVVKIPEFSIELQIIPALSKPEKPIIGPVQINSEGACVIYGQERLPSGKRKILIGKGFMKQMGYDL